MKNKDFDTDSVKYLGVILDSNITWTQYVSYIKKGKCIALCIKQDNI